MHRGHDRRHLAAVDPVRVRQIGCADLLHPPCILAVAGGAVGDEDLAPGLDPVDGVRRRMVGIAEREDVGGNEQRSEEHTSELQSLMRISYAVFCLKKKTNTS